MKIDVKFEDPNLISPKQFQDTLVLKIKDPEVNLKKFFVSENDQRPLSEDSAVLNYVIGQ